MGLRQLEAAGRVRFLLLFLLALPAFAQDIGWAACSHTRTDEKLVSVRVSFMVGDEEWSYRTLSGASLKTQVLTFKQAVAPTPLDGMKLDCRISHPELSRPARHFVHMPWKAPIVIPAGVSPKLAINVVETSPGLWRAYIGKAP